MTDDRPHLGDDPAAHLAPARRISLLSLGWTLVASSAATGLGLATHSVLLVALGAIGFVDAVGSAALAAHFHRARQRGEASSTAEARVHTVVVAGLLLVGTASAVLGLAHLLSGASGEPSEAATALAATSAVVLVVLARSKRRLARRVSSHALAADGQMSMVGAALSATTVAGSALAAADLGWADPVGAVVVGTGAVAWGLSSRRARRRPHP